MDIYQAFPERELLKSRLYNQCVSVTESKSKRAGYAEEHSGYGSKHDVSEIRR